MLVRVSRMTSSGGRDSTGLAADTGTRCAAEHVVSTDRGGSTWHERPKRRTSPISAPQVVAPLPGRWPDVPLRPEGKGGATTCAGPPWICRVPYRAVFDLMSPDAVQVADLLHVCKLANARLEEFRRRVQDETVGPRGRGATSLPVPAAVCPRPTNAHDHSRTRLLGLLDAGDLTARYAAALRTSNGLSMCPLHQPMCPLHQPVLRANRLVRLVSEWQTRRFSPSQLPPW